MGFRSVFKADPIRAAKEACKTAAEIERRSKACRRRQVYEDNSELIIKEEIGRVIKDREVLSRLNPFARLARAQAPFKRITNLLAGPIYLVDPVRTILPEDEQERWNLMEAEAGINQAMDTALHYAVANNAAFVQYRYSPRLDRIVAGVIPAEAVTVISDPDDPHQMLACIYDKQVMGPGGKMVTWHVYWDDTECFQLDENGNIVPFVKNGPAVITHPYGIIPILDLHVVPRVSGSYWNSTTGDDLLETNNATGIFTALSMRKLKARGFRPIVISGDLKSVSKEQSLDEEIPLVVPDGVQVTELTEDATADNYLALIESLQTNAGASRGLSRKRLNLEDPGPASADEGLAEQRANLIKYCLRAEQKQFEILKLISLEYPDEGRKLSPGATMLIDYGEVSERVDPKAELEIWDLRIKAGVANRLDQIKARNPEIRTDEEAWLEFERNLEVQAEAVRRQTERNMPKNADVLAPGQSPEANGSMGSLVRDGLMSKDEAAALSTGAPIKDSNKEE